MELRFKGDVKRVLRSEQSRCKLGRHYVQMPSGNRTAAFPRGTSSNFRTGLGVDWNCDDKRRNHPNEPAGRAKSPAFFEKEFRCLLLSMNKRELRILRAIWESVPVPDYQEHLRRVFEVLVATSGKTFDEDAGKKQDEAAGGRHSSN